MKIIFGTCISGNGHQTQAIAVKQYLEKQGINVIYNLVGKPYKNNIPKYFTDEFNIKQHHSFDFVFGKDGRVVLWKTILKGIFKLPRLILSFINICKVIKKEKPDAIFNFYEPLVGLTSIFFPNIKYVSFGHQYAMESAIYPDVKGYPIQKMFLGIINSVTSIKSKIVALSYYEFKDDTMIVSPPILRQESYVVSDKIEDFVLVYLMNEDMLPQLIDQAQLNPGIKIECFSKITRKHDVPSNLKLFNLDGSLFQQRMKVCKAVVCSGGFETASESILQKKPLLMIPMPNHYEQHSNVHDAKINGFAEWCSVIDLSKIPKRQIGNDDWFNRIDEVINKVL